MGEPNRQFRIQVKLSAVDSIPLVVIEGECDAFTAPLAHGAVNGLVNAGYKEIIIDLTDLRYMDAAGFHALDECCMKMKECCMKMKVAGGDIVLVNPSVCVEEIYEILRVRESCTIVDTLDEALARLRSRRTQGSS